MSWIDPELRWLLRRARPHRILYTSQLWLVLVSSLLALLDPLLLRWLIDGVLTWRQHDMLPWLAASFFGLFLFHYGFASLALMLDAYARERLSLSIRLGLLRRLQWQSAGFFDHHTEGDLLHRLEQDVEQICQLSGTSLAALLRVVVTTVLTVAIMSLLSWKLTLLVLPLVPCMLLLRKFGTPRLREASDRAQRASARRLAFAQDHLGCVEQVQLLGCQVAERRRYLALARRSLDAAVRRRGQELGLDGATQLTVAAASAVVLGFGGAQVLAGTLTVGGLVAFYTYLSGVFGPAQTLVQVYSNWQRASAGIRRVRSVLEEPLAVAEPAHPRSLPDDIPLSVELSGICFRYSGSRARDSVPTLDDLDLRIASRERVALIGASGSGKSTLVRLLVRAYEPGEGHVRLSGVDLGNVSSKELRSRVACVPQEAVLFSTTIRENLLSADSRADDDRLISALDMAQLGDLVRRLPGGLDAEIGARGSRLSGGQRQRLAVARAILQEPQLLILDEATSALDHNTERRLLEALQPFVVHRTVILVSHRTAAVRWATRIVMLGEGRVVADGSHDTLYRSSSAYRSLSDELCSADAVGHPERSAPRLPLREVS
ncbi:MAG: ABC transporter ATP-binding protein/permease [Thermoanaerobaculia bacterium]|nr:ABC transporter ATP-binding protein/permease [Thermoanaerobaculia bacterium]